MDINRLTIDIISAQGSLFEVLTSVDEVIDFQLHVLYNGKMVSTKKCVTNDRKSVIFQHQVTFDIHDFILDKTIDVERDLVEKACNSIVFLITCARFEKTTVKQLMHRILVAQATIHEYVAALYEGDYVSVELCPCLTDYIHSTGESSSSLFLRIDPAPYEILSKDHISVNLKNHSSLVASVGRDLLQQLKLWWARLRNEYPYISDRYIKLIGEDECGRHRFVGNFISPIQPSRDMNGPRFASRFVSLIPFHREVSLSGGRVSRWHSPFSTLARRCGDVEDHSILLCSLLLGWGLNAYVALGTLQHDDGSSQESFHCWVVTLCDAGDMKHWESLTGEVYDVGSSRLRMSHYRDIWSLFNQKEYLINIQSDCNCSSTSYDIQNGKFWRKFTLLSESLLLLSHPGSLVKLDAAENLDNNIKLEESLEKEIKEWIKTQRHESGLQTFFDEKLSTVLQSALASYELDRAAGVTFGNAEFQSSIRTMMNKGESFKAYPVCFNHRDVKMITNSLLKTSAARDIIFSKSGDFPDRQYQTKTLIGLRVRIFPYPVDVQAVWVIVAARYFSEIK